MLQFMKGVGNMEILKVILFLFIFLTLATFLYYLQKEKIIQTKLKETYDALDEISVERARERKRNLLYQEAPKTLFEKLLDKPGKQFVYSGLSYKLPGLTFEIWFLGIIFSAAGVNFIIYLITKDVFKSCIFMGVYIGLIKLIEVFCVFRNYKTVDDNLVKFLDYLGAYSITSGEITSIFYQISRFLPAPLNNVLEECYSEAQTSGDKSAALYAMASKIEHPQFKEIILNLESCMRYSADYRKIVSSSKKFIKDEKKAKMERKAEVREDAVEMIILSGAIVFAFSIVEPLAQRSVWEVMSQTLVGQCSMGAAIIFYIYFCIKISKVGR